MIKMAAVQFPAIKIVDCRTKEIVYVGQHYLYKTDLDLEEGDFVVVDAPKSGLTVVKVVMVKECCDTSKATKWIVDKVDVAAYQERKHREARKAELLTIMKAEAAKASDLLVYETLAKSSPEFKALLDEYKTL